MKKPQKREGICNSMDELITVFFFFGGGTASIWFLTSNGFLKVSAKLHGGNSF